mmetsp:Transcript_27653/g.59457  ORF Transcript_27653/g.59457 Transcript_27653/m.59457 type:complete len:323 (+) Transcript_27653:1330-2298(+)
MRRVDLQPASREVVSEGPGLHGLRRHGRIHGGGREIRRHVHDGRIPLGSQPFREGRRRGMDRVGLRVHVRGAHAQDADLPLGERGGERGGDGAGHRTGGIVRFRRGGAGALVGGVSDAVREAELRRQRTVEGAQPLLAVRRQRHRADGVSPRSQFGGIGVSHADVGESRLRLPLRVRGGERLHRPRPVSGRRVVRVRRSAGAVDRSGRGSELRRRSRRGRHVRERHVGGGGLRPVRDTGGVRAVVRGVDGVEPLAARGEGESADLPVFALLRGVRVEFVHVAHWGAGEVSIPPGRDDGGDDGRAESGYRDGGCRLYGGAMAV